MSDERAEAAAGDIICYNAHCLAYPIEAIRSDEIAAIISRHYAPVVADLVALSAERRKWEEVAADNEWLRKALQSGREWVKAMCSEVDRVQAERDAALAENEHLGNAQATDERLLADIQAVLAQVEQERDRLEADLQKHTGGCTCNFCRMCAELEETKARLAKIEEAATGMIICGCGVCRGNLILALGREVQSG